MPVLSRRSIKLSVSELLVQGELEIYPEVISKGYFSLQFQGKNLQLTAGPFVGLIPINGLITIDVRPKLPVGNLARVIDLTRSPLTALSRLKRSYVADGDSSPGMLEFLTGSLLEELKVVFTKGLNRVYVKTEENTSHPRGRLNAERTFRLNFIKGIGHRASSSFFWSTTNTAHNQLIRFALQFAAERLSRLENRNRDLLDGLAAALRQFEAIPTGDPRACIRQVEDELRLNKVRRSYYVPSLEIALAIVRGRSVVSSEGGNLELPSYIINFETLFEDYLRKALSWKEHDAPFEVSDGNGAGQKPLFDDSPHPPAQPDILIRRDDLLVVVDVKYKEKVDRADVNQVVTYASVYRTNVVVLLHQASAEGEGGLFLRGTIGALSVYCYQFNLGASDLLEEENRLVRAMNWLVSGRNLSQVTSEQFS
ncbi:McrC family protein [Bradyrhizobium septentrionale]|uniref:Restriction endonuclease n=1 Tax=Bradyrhizobium septentrionale TaxID=1404411 RepID=A0ABZ2P2C4_9BRAD